MLIYKNSVLKYYNNKQKKNDYHEKINENVPTFTMV